MGLHRRLGRTVAEKKELKRLYDIEYRAKNGDRLRTQKREYYQKTWDKWAAYRRRVYKTKRAYMRRYMRRYLSRYWTPEKIAEKAEYDRKWRAKKFGPFWESHLLVVELNKEIKARLNNYEIRLKNGTLNKTLNRSRNGEIKRGYA